MKKDYLIGSIILLLTITTLAVLREHEVEEALVEIQEANQNLQKQVAGLEKEADNSSNISEELKIENKQLVKNLLELNEEVESLKSPLVYQDFNEAIRTVESYKKVDTFREIREFFSAIPEPGRFGVSFSTLDREGNCPCGIGFNVRSIEWKPNSILDLSEFRIEKDKILLTYNTIEDINRNYQFVMTKARGWEDTTVKWRIEEIKLKEDVQKVREK